MKALQGAGYVLAMATNQPGPAKGQFSREAVTRTNAALFDMLAASGVEIAAHEVCLHHPEGGPGGDPSLVCACACRKPKPGMLVRLLERLGADRGHSWMIGDSVGDLQAGVSAGLQTGLVFSPHRCELCPMREGPTSPRPDVAGETLMQVATAISRRT
jgi:D-glycero-D-manno-heptose 1,7-bisphosphate phosphatase